MLELIIAVGSFSLGPQDYVEGQSLMLVYRAGRGVTCSTKADALIK
jgi:hypothetical protein